MSKLIVFGHQNPDTDAISSAIAFSYLQNQLGTEAEAVALGEPNEETAYALKYFNVEAPRVVDTLKSETDLVALVDHNEPQQSVSDISKLSVKYVIDHHRIANFETSEPVYYRAHPVGCTCSILYHMFVENNVEIPQHIAGLMLSAIISDTLLFKSPTTTPYDEAAAKALTEIAQVDLPVYGLEMLKAGTNLSTKTAAELIDLDAKTFEMGEKKVRIAQVNTVSLPELLERQVELVDTMKQANVTNGYDAFLLMMTDILASDTDLLIVGELNAEVEKAYNGTIVNQIIKLPGVVSRKKQIVPQLTDAIEK
ncbi:manganese-dependent inorganic pyrophosphatase [Atopobacter phocae]|uniref:manganese-dependent inorganic pyrophosphatase n=1 Tax=Atopobacter phocae TaxID=136492 RepID=UPI00047029A9|nr:manganese-dependent inorganic pyrophosphatase [Atopobacter phocae]